MYCVSKLPLTPFNTFLSGDGNNKCFVWAIKPKKTEDDSRKYECVVTGELEGHTETIEFIKFNHDAKLCVTGGMNNVLRVWSVESNPDPMRNDYKLKLKTKLENGPAEKDDILFVEWHPKGNAILCGGADYMLYLLNGATGEFLGCFSGHEGPVHMGHFTPNGKLIISSSEDKTIRVWSPIKQECVSVIKSSNGKKFHECAINVFAIHPELPIIFSGDLAGGVFSSNYQTGEVGEMLGSHNESVESIEFCQNPKQPYCVSVGMDQFINIYNTKDLKLRQKVTASEYGGFTKVKFSEIDDSMFYASSTRGDVVIIDVRNGMKLRTYKGHAAPINDFVEVLEHRLLVTAGDDFVCNVYDLSKEPESMKKIVQEEEKKE